MKAEELGKRAGHVKQGRDCWISLHTPICLAKQTLPLDSISLLGTGVESNAKLNYGRLDKTNWARKKGARKKKMDLLSPLVP